jgi:diguanylate cyclase (GGDEF)-like protein/PAS domain S-box-containing protein
MAHVGGDELDVTSVTAKLRSERFPGLGSAAGDDLSPATRGGHAPQGNERRRELWHSSSSSSLPKQQYNATREEDGCASIIMTEPPVPSAGTFAGEAVSAFEGAHELLKILVAETQDYAIFMLDTEGNVASWNPGAERFKGYQSHEIIGRHFSLFYPPEDIEAGKPERELAITAAEGRIEDEGWRVRQDGTRFWANVVITALRDADGVLRGYGKVTRDITERRAQEVAIMASEERFRSAFDTALTGMMTFGLDGRYSRVNNAFCTIVGHTPETLIGVSREQITHPDDLAPDAESLRALLAGEMTSYVREKRYIHAAGHDVWAQVSVTLINDSAGRPSHFSGQVLDITERRRYEEQLVAMADHDPLTGLLNRRTFERELDAHLTRVKRFKGGGALLMIDLDHFKFYNDTQGHTAGDELIVLIAQTLRDRLRETDVIGRLGGDEFAVLLPNEDHESAEVVARSLVEGVREKGPAIALGQLKRVTASIGIACFKAGDRLTADEIMVNADLAMYDAKDGRDRIAHYRAAQHTRPRMESQMKRATEITDALAHDRFELLAQTIQPLSGHGPAQHELLLRMRGSHNDLIPPATFLDIAERLGLVRDIDRWVTARAIDTLAEYRAAGHDLRLEVNLSGHTIGDEKLLELIERRLGETGVAPDRLIFEITETAAIANITRAATFVDRLSALGCKFALDDFGAGFGSFYYLKHLPFDYLKIDGEFVRHCVENETDRILIAAVVHIARGMGKLTIAEYVENQETVDVLTLLGVDYAQGYHVGRPAPLEDHQLESPTASADEPSGARRS